MYSCGFLFSEDRSNVLLIQKERPAWQKGFLNGVGGLVEYDELPLQAMIREMREEAGIEILEWENVAALFGWEFTVFFFAAFSNDIYRATTKTDELLHIVSLDRMPANVLPNLRFLIPLALDNTVVKPVLMYDQPVNNKEAA